MLGAEQSGFIADLGYETYQKILEEAVDELKSEEFADLYADNTEGHRDTGSEYVRGDLYRERSRIDVPSHLHPQRLGTYLLYRELDNMEEERDILAFTERLKDRFGKIPKEGKGIDPDRAPPSHGQETGYGEGDPEERADEPLLGE